MNPSSLKLPSRRLQLWRAGRRTGKITLLFTLLCAGQLYGMEEKKSEHSLYESFASALTSAYSHISSWFSQEYIQTLRKDRDDFREKLYESMRMKGMSTERQTLLSDPHMFLVVCFQYYNVLTFCNHNVLTSGACYDNLNTNDTYLLEKLQKAEMDGYSAIGAVMLAAGEAPPIESKRNFIQQLLDLGFKPTKKDMIIAELALYDAIPENEKEKMILFLREKDILPEIKKNIVSCMIEPYRVTSWPLPDSASEK
jgi:hypothetical protein